MNQELLSQLRDIHLPSEPSWWPPAPGYYIVFALGLLFFALTIFIIRWWRKNSRIKRLLRKEILSIEKRFQAGASVAALQTELNWLLRRAALVKQQKKKKDARTEDLSQSMLILFGNDEKARLLESLLEQDRFKAENSLDGHHLLRLFKELMKTCRI